MDWRLPTLLLAFALGAAPAEATTVRSVALGEMLEAAALVFEGRVHGVETRSGPRRIETCARFEVLEVLSGPPVASPLTLCFAGGALGTRSYRVGGLRVPAEGEHGIYFVESLDAPLLNPLYGWSQGHFRVLGDPGGVHTADGQPVTDMDDGASQAPLGASDGVARGVGVAPRRGAAEVRGLSPDAFKERLRALRGEPR